MNAGPFRSAAELYWKAGWLSPLPLPANAKRDPPKGYTGAEGRVPSWPDIQTWLDNGVADGNICLRMPDDVIGIDVDMYDGKQGRETLAELEAKWGPLPDTWMSSSRDDGSGIRFYRVPAGRKWPSIPGPGIEIIQHGHRYAVVWPSVHPNGAMYRWASLDGLRIDPGMVPRPAYMQELPTRWVDGLANHATTGTASGWTDPDLDALVEHGIPAGVNQDEALRDVVWKLRRDGVGRSAARAIWREIVEHTTLTDPSWPWDDSKDFRRQWDGADRKLPVPLTGFEPSTAPKRKDDEPTPLFVDVDMMLTEGLPEPPAPTVLRRTDGVALFYPEQVNVLFGDPECGKTWIAYAAICEALAAGKRGAVVDTDHNGATSIITRLVAMGADQTRLRDPAYFRLAEPDDKTELAGVIGALREWAPHVVVVDSVGEVLPMLGLSSNSPDDYTTAHRVVLTALARSGAAVIAIDHLPKSDEARVHGQTGTVAKRRAVGGISLRVTLLEVFTPGRGGAASLSIHKDRPGGLRAKCPVDGKYQPAGVFVMKDDLTGGIDYRITEPKLSDRTAGNDDVALIDGWFTSADPPSQRKVLAKCKEVDPPIAMSGERARAAVAAWKLLREEI